MADSVPKHGYLVMTLWNQEVRYRIVGTLYGKEAVECKQILTVEEKLGGNGSTSEAQMASSLGIRNIAASLGRCKRKFTANCQLLRFRSLQLASTEAGPPTHLQVVPAELVLAPGETVQFKARAFDRQGRPTDSGQASWSLDGIEGSFGEEGRFTVSSDLVFRTGLAKATVGEISAVARVRVIPPLPWSVDFDSVPLDAVPRTWIGAPGKFKVREVEGEKILVKLADNPRLRRARVYMGPSHLTDYSVSVDIRAGEKRRQMGNAGVVAQRYSLVLYGNHQRLELQSWQAEPERAVKTSFAWDADTWYRLKLQVENLDDGTVRVRGKAWPVSEPEPSSWTLEKVDPFPNLKGSPGIYADVPAEIFFDNLEVKQNP